jgi:hypothetical protein
MDMRKAIGKVRAGAQSMLVVVGIVLLVSSCSSGSGSSAGPKSTTTTLKPSPQSKTYPPKIALFGDSLSGEAEPYYTDLIHATGERALTYDSFGGTAICDFLPKMRAVAADDHPKAVELQFTGNALTPCMRGYNPPSQAYYDKYRADTETAINIFLPEGAHVYLISAPITRGQQASEPNWDRLNLQYAQIAAADPQHVTYVDAGTAVEGPGHTYVQTLPCLQLEPCIGPVVDKVPSNTVRSPDGTHFCPVVHGDEAGIIGFCSTYSSGAYRYADAMVEALATSVEAPQSP